MKSLSYDTLTPFISYSYLIKLEYAKLIGLARESSTIPNMTLPSYLMQTEKSSKKETIKQAVDLFWNLVKQKNTSEKAKQIVCRKMVRLAGS